MSYQERDYRRILLLTVRPVAVTKGNRRTTYTVKLSKRNKGGE